ncbi:MAG: hypothetical protein M3Q97_09215, partial [Bacteroidota bacterium]|nr:hypothetical protein [Bacteroidota bacterium]
GNSDFKYFPLGARIGADVYMENSYGLGGKLELGIRPGLRKDSNLYITLGINYVLPVNTGVVRDF